MTKSKLLTITIIVLVLINSATLAFFFFKAPRSMEKNKPKEIVIEKLYFDKSQITSYEALIKIHSEKIKSLNDAILNTKNNLYKELSKSDNRTTTDSLFAALASQQSQIEKTHYNHFLDIKKLCKPEQLNDFNELSNELSKIFSSKNPPIHNNRGDRP